MLQLLTTTFKDQTSEDPRTSDIINILRSTDIFPDLDTECQGCPFDVTNFLPTWLVNDHYSGETLFVKFIQYYFDWLYCTNQSTIYMDSLFDLFDVENINEKTKESIIKSNIPGMYEIIKEHESEAYKVNGTDPNYPDARWFYPVYISPPDEPYHVHNISGLFNDTNAVTFYMPNSARDSGGGHYPSDEEPIEGTLFEDSTSPYAISLDKLKILLKNIKHNLYQKKTTKEAISFFFKTIIDSNVEVVVTEAPGTIDIRLISPDIRTDDKFIDLCRKLYEEILHPIGMSYTLIPDSSFLRMSSEQKDNDLEFRRSKGSKSNGFTFSAFEMPRLGNYYVYIQDDISTLSPVTGCIDLTPIPRGITENDAHMPTYTHPNWNQGYSGGTSFGNINISEFMILPFENNPNFGITACANL